MLSLEEHCNVKRRIGTNKNVRAKTMYKKNYHADLPPGGPRINHSFVKVFLL